MLKKFRIRASDEFKFLKKYFKSFLFLTFYNFYFLSVPATNFVFYLSKPIKTTHIIDFLHKVFPEYHAMKLQHYPQAALWLVSVILLFILPFVLSVFHNNRIFAVKNYLALCTIGAILFTIRAVCMTVTLLPDPYYLCRMNLVQKPQNVFGKKFTPFKI